LVSSGSNDRMATSFVGVVVRDRFVQRNRGVIPSADSLCNAAENRYFPDERYATLRYHLSTAEARIREKHLNIIHKSDSSAYTAIHQGRDFNDLYLFAQIVFHDGYSAASRNLGIPKSTLSRRIAALEERLGSRLVQRSSRTFAVTAAGQLFLKHCIAMIAEADAAELAVVQTQARPRGLVRVSCPISMAQSMLGPILPQFLSENSEVNVSLVSTNRSVNLIEEGFDVALFIHRTPLQDSSLIVRAIGTSPQVLVASPHVFRQVPRPRSPVDLRGVPTISMNYGLATDDWRLFRGGESHTAVVAEPRLIAENLLILKDAALGGVGVARLPKIICGEELRDGRLEVVLPDWSMPPHEIHACYPSRKGVPPAVRSFVEFVAKSLGERLARI
jgi:DNA-binding transcriptional LysR family regulator